MRVGEPMIEPQTIRSALDELGYNHSQDRDGNFEVPIYAFGKVVLAFISIDCGNRFLEIRSIGLSGSHDEWHGSSALQVVASEINRRYRAVKAMLESDDSELVVCVDQWFRDAHASVDNVAFLFRLFVKVVREALGAIIARSTPLPQL